MTFLSAFAFWGLLAVPVFILLAWWRAHHRELPVASLLLWERVRTQLRETSRRRHRWFDPLLLLGVFFIIFACLSAAGPALWRPSAGGRQVVFLLDSSASMQTLRPDGRTRRQHLLDGVRKFAASLDPQDTLYLFTLVNGQTRLVSASPPDVADAIRAFPITHGRDDAHELLRFALVALPNVPRENFVLCTDRIDPARLPPGVQLFLVGDPSSNLGITGFEVEPAGERLRAFVRLKNFSSRTAEARVDFFFDNRDGPKVRCDLPPGGAVDVIREFPAGDIQKISAEITAPAFGDTFRVDNRVVALRREPSRFRVLLVGKQDVFLPHLFRVMDVSFTYSPTLTGVDPAEHDLVLYNQIIPRPPLPRHAISIDPPAGFGEVTVAEQLAEPKLTTNDPTLRKSGLERTSIARARKLILPAGFDVLASADGNPLIATRARPDSWLRLISFDIGRENTDWPSRPSYVVFWAQTMADIRGAMPEGKEAPFRYLRTGEALEVFLPEGAEPSLTRPGQAPEKLIPQGPGRWSHRPMLADIYRVQAGNFETFFAVNLLSESESNNEGRNTPDFRPRWTAGDVTASRLENLSPVFLFVGLVFLLLYWSAAIARYRLARSVRQPMAGAAARPGA